MGRKRSTIIKADFGEQLDFFDHMLDCVTLGVKEYAVEQAGFNPPYAMVMSSRVWPRDPRTQMERLARMERAMLKRFDPNLARPGLRYCGWCTEWLPVSRFSPKQDAYDKMHPYCKACRNEHARRMYLLQKQGYTLKAA